MNKFWPKPERGINYLCVTSVKNSITKSLVYEEAIKKWLKKCRLKKCYGGGGVSKSQRWGKTISKQSLLCTNVTGHSNALMNSPWLWLPSQDLHKTGPARISSWKKRKAPEAPPLPERLVTAHGGGRWHGVLLSSLVWPLISCWYSVNNLGPKLMQRDLIKLSGWRTKKKGREVEVYLVGRRA